MKYLSFSHVIAVGVFAFALPIPALSPPALQPAPGPFIAVPASTGSNTSQPQAQAALDFHNAKRQAVGAPPLAWSPDLAAVAQNWANHLATDLHCNLQHTSGSHYGENLFGGRGMAFTALDATNNWYGEVAKFHYGALTETDWSPSGHYTQMVWATTTKVGIGQASCSDGSQVIVAEYDPPGNYIGEKPY